MTDANQRWDVQQAIDWMKPFAKFNIRWIEEPTSPDDVLGHLAISKVYTSIIRCPFCQYLRHNKMEKKKQEQ